MTETTTETEGEMILCNLNSTTTVKPVLYGHLQLDWDLSVNGRCSPNRGML